MYGDGTQTTLILEIPRLNVPIEYTNTLSEQIDGYQPPNYDDGTQSVMCGALSTMGIACLKLQLTNTLNPNDDYVSDNSFQPGLYSVNLMDRPTFTFTPALTIDTSYEGTLITTWDADPADGDQTGEEIFFMDWSRPAGCPTSAAEPGPGNLRRSTPSLCAHRSYGYACAALGRAPCILHPVPAPRFDTGHPPERRL